MIWVSWRQQRTETLIAALVLAALAALLVPTGLHLSSLYRHDGVAACLAHATGGCAGTFVSFNSRTEALGNLMGWFKLVPGLIAILLAAPLVLELEQGTFRLAWTQSITRRRWLSTKLALITLAALAAALTLTLLFTWWRNPLDHFHGRMDPDGFDLEGIVPFAYVLFAAALIIALGAALRRTLPAIGIALMVFILVRLGVATWARPHYEAAVSRTWPAASSGPDLRTAWVLTQGQTDAHGHALPDAAAIFQTCAKGLPTRLANTSCLQRHGLFQHAVYQPAGRFWIFQAIEAGIFTALAVALLAFGVWWIRHRVS